MKSYILFFFVLMTIGVSGQIRLKVANKAYDDGDYYYAIENYKKVLENYELDSSRSNDVKLKLATCYFKVNDYVEAEYWLGKLIKLGNFESYHILYYAKCLQYNGKYDLAMEYYSRYERSTVCFSIPRDFSNYCAYLDSLKEHPNAKISNLDSINTETDEFCPFIFKNEVGYFIEAHTQGTWNWNFYYKLNHPSLPYLENVLSISINNENNIFITKKLKIDRRAIYKIYNKNLKTNDLSGMPFNSDNYTCAYPAISPDGKTMIFSSDMPGGFGGMDFYQSELDSNGRWRAPMNLGPTINTEGNETYPFFQNDSTLYFSSDGHLGFGGIDIYKCKIDFKENEFEITDIETLGSPINTNADDFGIFLDESGKHGYFTSDRDGGKGGDDIWEFWLK